MSRDKKDQRNESEEFPGYPHYPANEDVTNADNNNGILPVNEENIALPNAPTANQVYTTVPDSRPADEEDDVQIVMGTEADVTDEDLQLLDAMDGDLNTDNELEEALDNRDDDGELLNERTGNKSATGEDLDVPGSEDDDANEAIGEEDEENNYYSLSDNEDDNDTEGNP